MPQAEARWPLRDVWPSRWMWPHCGKRCWVKGPRWLRGGDLMTSGTKKCPFFVPANGFVRVFLSQAPRPSSIVEKGHEGQGRQDHPGKGPGQFFRLKVAKRVFVCRKWSRTGMMMLLR
jgi:hypothetical protein